MRRVGAGIQSVVCNSPGVSSSHAVGGSGTVNSTEFYRAAAQQPPSSANVLSSSVINPLHLQLHHHHQQQLDAAVTSSPNGVITSNCRG